MVSPETIAAFRYGYGPRPGGRVVGDPAGLLTSLPAPRTALANDWDARFAIFDELSSARKDRRHGIEGAQARNKAADRVYMTQVRQDEARAIQTAIAAPVGFAERLLAFWSDHFTVAAHGYIVRLSLPHMHATAIAPHINGRFKDMLRAVTQHPAMLNYLDQTRSFGPNSPAGQDRGRGLNENLAREVLELHTLGVGAPYTQEDVRQLAELMTGLSHGRDGFVFRRGRVEPGPETVLGRSYGGYAPIVAPIEAAMNDLAMHPATARHLATKLVVHFLGAPAPEDLVAQMAEAYLGTDTQLSALYEVMLADPRAWSPQFRKARTPFEFLVAAHRAAGTDPATFDALKPKQVRIRIVEPLTRMGQPFWRPQGPDGWSEAPEDWISPVGLSARLGWSDAFAKEALQGIDPRAFLDRAVGDKASAALRFAVAGAESRSEGHVLVLASPEFNRR